MTDGMGTVYDAATGAEVQRTGTKKETDEKCPACGGTMEYDPSSQGLLCPFCGAQKQIETATGAVEQDFATAETTASHDWGAEKKAVICKSCGAESIYDVLQTAGVCPYCGSTQVMEQAAPDAMAPGGVIPFKIDKKTAGQRFMAWLKGKLFTPTAAKKSAKPEAFTGVYLPYWTFDADTTTSYAGQFGRNRTVRDRDGKTRVVTDWFPVSGVHNEFVDDALVCGTERHEPGLIRSIEPFNTGNNLAYKPEYVAGFVAERYSVGVKDAFERAKTFIMSLLRGHVESRVRQEKSADIVRLSTFEVNMRNIKFKYLLLPVWISSFSYKGKVFQFLVNGETGKVAGRAPVSPLRVAVAIVLTCLFVWLMYMLFQNS